MNTVWLSECCDWPQREGPYNMACSCCNEYCIFIEVCEDCMEDKEVCSCTEGINGTS